MADGQLDACVLTGLDELAAVESEWRALAEAAGDVFTSPEWALAWLDVYGDEYRPSVRVVRRDGRVVGVLPLVTEARGALRFAGDGAGDVFSPLVADGCGPEVLAALFATLPRDRLLVLTNVERASAWRTQLRESTGFAGLVDRPRVLPYIDLAGLDWERFLAGRSSHFRAQVRRKERMLAREHDASFRLARTAGELALDLETFFALHDLRWSDRGGSTSSSVRVREFLAAAASRLLETGWLRLWTMTVDDEAAASWLGWRVGGRYAFYLPGFDPRFSRLSPGMLLMAHTIRAALDEGATVYDMLLGDEEYKARFATGRREVETELLGPRGRLLLGRADRELRRLGRLLPAPVRVRVRALAAGVEQRLPLSRRR